MSYDNFNNIQRYGYFGFPYLGFMPYPSGETEFINVNQERLKNVIRITNNRAQYYSELAKQYKEEAKNLRDNTRYYSEQNTANLSGKADVNLSNVNDSGKSLLISWVMPSRIYSDVTLGTSGSTYTAPSNGYYTAANNSGSISILNTHSGLISSSSSGGVCLPVLKNDVVQVDYTSSPNYLRFVYAKGSESDAE